MVGLNTRLKQMSTRELREIAQRAGISPDESRKREELVERLANAAGIEGILDSWEKSLQHILEKMSLKELKDLAARHLVELPKPDKKKEVIAAILAHPMAPAIGDSLGAVASLDKIKGELEEVKTDVIRIVAEIKVPPMEDPVVDPMLKQATSVEVDFDHSEDLLDQARMRFEEKNFEGSLSAAIEARESAERSKRELDGAALAYSILSAQRLVEECGKVGSDVEMAADVLRKAKRMYKEGEVAGLNELLRDLEAMSRTLFSAEIQRARDEMHKAQDVIHDVANLGADVRRAEEVLAGAKDALKRNEYKTSIEFAARAIEMAQFARTDRLKRIEESIPATLAVIEDAKNVGADVVEAERIVSKAKTALAAKEYLLASELIKRAEKAAMESQQNQILRAMELRKRQVEKAQTIVAQIEPVIEEAESFGIDVSEARTLLQQAKDILAEGDYVNGTIFAKNAAEVTRKLEPKLVEERGKRGIAKPTGGVCASCGSSRVEFTDDGWSRCADCGYRYRWRAPGGVWSRFKSLWKD